jgi:rubrerythrin
MTILTPTKDAGATTKPAPMVYAEPERIVDEEELGAPFADSGLNGAFVADMLSAMVAHERCGVHLYRSAEARANNPVLKAKYQEFGAQTHEHVEILEALISGLGGNPAYVSPMARAVEAMDANLLESTFLGSGSLDPMTAESSILDAVFIAETIDHANWETLEAMSEDLPAGATKDACAVAIARVREQEDEHFEWARSTRQRLVTLQAESELMATAGMKFEALVARVKGWFSN